ncbi:FMRFamide receptor-like isoform X1 [Haliotis rubra]|uniref:FMRFamide receptor-like isoform X1 n=1 Tax=Haliotis rubra TaxID=36100 RepID=UPI001EE59663|nr:FMRFamide receptor-like isoform X1 [Haliotis rubra]XP_046568349.1 FMRFamide receptor-like isoform X1 [Haliotis rubra]XP_046568350.1 FMRFamide receptor-like isoform X1 [Haliotis rubra]XP_046568351.1 FMRFamide receptor-like isoform X1 [Haliotis rubra]XP_046568352.1 FMRFamide receptor-like isoform X1 [Haliotis rubra]
MSLGEINLRINLSYGGGSYIQDEGGSQEPFLWQFIFWGILLPLVALSGIVGNILTMVVLWRREMQSPTIFYLRALVVSDTGILLMSVIALTPFACSNYLESESLVYYREVIYPPIHTPLNFIMMSLQAVNVWVTVSVSVERYIAICHPFRAARICTKKKALVVIIVIVIVSIGYNIPRMFATHARECSEAEKSHGQACFYLADTELGNTWSYKTVYGYIMFCIIIYVVPLGVLFILNVFIIQELMRMQQRRSGLHNQDDNEANLSLVLVLIVVVFIFCQTPGLLAQFDIFEVHLFHKWLAVSNFLFVLNSAVNFLIYTAFGRKFRKVLLRIFHKLYKHSRSMSISRTAVTSNGYELTNVNDLNHDQTTLETYYGLRGCIRCAP